LNTQTNPHIISPRNGNYGLTSIGSDIGTHGILEVGDRGGVVEPRELVGEELNPASYRPRHGNRK
jgi:hypothetical protein